MVKSGGSPAAHDHAATSLSSSSSVSLGSFDQPALLEPRPGAHHRHQVRATPPRPHKGGHGSLNGGLGLVPLTVPEVRRLLVALVWTTPFSPASCWPGHDGADAIRPVQGAHTTTAAKDKCGWSISWYHSRG